MNAISEYTSLNIEEKDIYLLEKLIDHWRYSKSVRSIFENIDRITKARSFATLLSFYKHGIVRFEQLENFHLKEILVGPKIIEAVNC